MSKNIQIPYELFIRLLSLLENIEISNIDENLKQEFEYSLKKLQDKKNAINKRDLYLQLIAANKEQDEDRQLDTRIEYLKKRLR